jgi:hypothetical protein
MLRLRRERAVGPQHHQPSQEMPPTPGRGWGCVVCDLPADGALAVVCDACLEKRAPLRFACQGYPGKDGRVPIDLLFGDHNHDMSKHPEESAPGVAAWA